MLLAAAGPPTPGPYDYWDWNKLLNGPQCRPYHRAAAPAPPWARPRRMTVLTDSVLMGATPTLRAAKPCWRVRGGGIPGAGTWSVMKWVHFRRVAPLVVIGLGYNSSWERSRAHYGFWAGKFDADAHRLLRTLRRRGARQFVWLTVRQPTRRYVARGSWPQISTLWYLRYVNERLRKLDRSRDDLVLADWAHASRRRGLTYDSIHLKPRGAKLMVRTIRSTITAESRRQARKAHSR
jgi:hypothetical protein